LVYESLQQHKKLQQNIEQLARLMQTQRARQSQSRYLFGVGATLLVSGAILMLKEVVVFPGWLMAAGIVVWIIGWKRTV
jgi:ubiquinone biosynthesis protein